MDPFNLKNKNDSGLRGKSVLSNVRKKRNINSKDSAVEIKNRFIDHFIQNYKQGKSLEDILKKNEFDILKEKKMDVDEKSLLISYFDKFFRILLISFQKYIESEDEQCCEEFYKMSDKLKEFIENYGMKLRDKSNIYHFLIRKDMEYATYIEDHYILKEYYNQNFKLSNKTEVIKNICDEFYEKMQILFNVIKIKEDEARDNSINIIEPFANLLQSHIYEYIGSKFLNTSILDGVMEKNICKILLKEIQEQSNPLNLTTFHKNGVRVKSIGPLENSLICKPNAFVYQNPYQNRISQISFTPKLHSFVLSTSGLFLTTFCISIIVCIFLFFIKKLYIMLFKKRKNKQFDTEGFEYNELKNYDSDSDNN